VAAVFALLKLLLHLAAWFVHSALGDSLQALRLLPALAGAGTVFLTGLLAIEMGGGAFAVALACLCAIASPVYLSMNTLFTMNAFEPLFWMGAVYLVLRALRRNQPKLRSSPLAWWPASLSARNARS
jgi:dolichyl-phosphate-mannose--protein O-mannosyl transferase